MAKKPPSRNKKPGTAKKSVKPKAKSLGSKAKSLGSKPKSLGSKPKSSGKSTAKVTTAKSPGRDTLVSVREHIGNIVKRLDNADKLTQRSVKALEQAFEALEKRLVHDDQINKDALSQRIKQLSDKLTQQVKDTQYEVARNLKSALEDPSLTGLQAAVAAADVRVGQTEQKQVESLAKVNRHIAEMARAIDARLTKNEQALTEVQYDLTLTKSRLETKIQDIEQSSAKAVIELGERFVNLSNSFNHRTETNANIISKKITEISLKTQDDFDTYRRKLENRLETLEEKLRYQDSHTERNLETIATRIDSLEYGLTSVALPQQGSFGVAAAPVIANIPNSPTDTQDNYQQDQSNTVIELSSLETPVEARQDKITTADYTTSDYSSSDFDSSVNADPEPLPLTEPVKTGLVEFDPTEFAPQATAEAVTPSPYVPAQSQSHYLAQTQPDLSLQSNPVAYQDTNFVQPTDIAPMEPVPAYTAEPTYAPTPVQDAAHNLTTDDLPYADPAYAENMGEPAFERPGGPEITPRKMVARPSLFTGRNLKTAGLAVAVMTMGYFALRGFTGKTQNPIALPDDLPSLAENAGLNPVSTPQTAATIGQYEDNRGFDLNGAVPTVTSLNAAAETGDAVAEFQLGLSKLQAGETADAVELIRSAANKGQPAAQYRLAKLYETGEGVAADPAVARQLTERAARAGNRIAMHDLALYYAEGRGDVDTSIQTAAGWFEKAAERGVVDSQFNLGVLSESGQGLPLNLENAYFWYSVAGGQGDQFAQQRLDILRGQMDADDITKAETRAFNFKPASIDEAANGIFKNANVATASSKSDILTAQTLLANLGYDAGGADGTMGPKTRSAIVEYQQDIGLTATGVVDAELLQSLEQSTS